MVVLRRYKFWQIESLRVQYLRPSQANRHGQHPDISIHLEGPVVEYPIQRGHDKLFEPLGICAHSIGVSISYVLLHLTQSALYHICHKVSQTVRLCDFGQRI